MNPWKRVQFPEELDRNGPVAVTVHAFVSGFAVDLVSVVALPDGEDLFTDLTDGEVLWLEARAAEVAANSRKAAA